MPHQPGISGAGHAGESAASRVRAGQRVGEWILDTRLGIGAFGEVWRARHHVWAEEHAAIKLPNDDQYVRALQREGTTTHKLEHPGIVRPLGMDPFAEIPYLVMEYVPGADLRRHIAEAGRLAPEAATAIIRQVLLALDYAHGQGVVHRDIKPENILLHEQGFANGFAAPGTVKLTDFGLGQASRAHKAATSIAFSTDVRGEQAEAARQLAGTLDYMAPEQRAGQPVDGRADLYACGVVLFEMLTGDKPAGTDVPSEVNRTVPAWLDEAFRRSYARLERRFGSAREFLDALGPSRSAAQTSYRALPLAAVGHAGAATSANTCPSCSGRVEGEDQFCMHCGHQLAGVVRRCNRCGAFPAPADQFCIFCGGELLPGQTPGPTDVVA